MGFNDEIGAKAKQIETVIRKYLPEESGLPKTVFSAMNYAVNAGGKRLRPMLMAETAALFGGASEDLLHPFMAAIEMIHTYSLIHDDLPALDNDDYRRGRKTTHVVYGEAMAILAGDSLLNYAFETAAKALEYGQKSGGEDLLKASKAMQVLCRKPGIYGMIGGQVVDVERTGQPLDAQTLEFIYINKTSALIECSMMIGAILAGADDTQVQCVEAAARAIGIAFQIQDDILDVTSTLEELGKPVGSDEKNDKTTYVTLEGMENAQKKVEALTMEALAKMDTLDITGKNPFLKALILWLIHRNK